MKKRWYGILAGTAALTMAMGCAAGAEEEISGELNIMHYIAEASKLEAFDDIVEGFETEYPDVKVNAESTTLENYQDRRCTGYPVRKPEDVFELDRVRKYCRSDG